MEGQKLYMLVSVVLAKGLKSTIERPLEQFFRICGHCNARSSSLCSNIYCTVSIYGIQSGSWGTTT